MVDVVNDVVDHLGSALNGEVQEVLLRVLQIVKTPVRGFLSVALIGVLIVSRALRRRLARGGPLADIPPSAAGVSRAPLCTLASDLGHDSS